MEASTKKKTNLKIKDATSALGNTGQCCSNCHERHDTVRHCRMAKYESVFRCGGLSRQTDDKQEFHKKGKREIGTLESSLRK